MGRHRNDDSKQFQKRGEKNKVLNYINCTITMGLHKIDQNIWKRNKENEMKNFFSEKNKQEKYRKMEKKISKS